jgi:hypothetical protein
MNVFFQLYHDENELHLMRAWRDYDDIRFVLDQHAKLDLLRDQIAKVVF